MELSGRTSVEKRLQLPGPWGKVLSSESSHISVRERRDGETLVKNWGIHSAGRLSSREHRKQEAEGHAMEPDHGGVHPCSDKDQKPSENTRFIWRGPAGLGLALKE